MAKFELIMPKMGESVQEATITKWFKKAGDTVEEDEPVLEIATDKVDSEIPSPVDGIIEKVLFNENDVVVVGAVIAIINTDGDAEVSPTVTEEPIEKESTKSESVKSEEVEQKVSQPSDLSKTDKFLSPLVKSIAQKEQVSAQELNSIDGTGRDGRIKKEDILSYLQQRTSAPTGGAKTSSIQSHPQAERPKVSISIGAEDTIVQMDRMRKMIAEHMIHSKQVSPHVTSVVEVDVTAIVQWREKTKDDFQKKHGEKLTYMPIFTEAVAKSLRDFPGVNASVDGDNIILRKHVNVGIAVALPDGNLIVPVIRDTDQKNLAGIASNLNALANKARQNKLSPDDIQGGTFTITNFGSFRNIIGTPIINQPQVAILATGSIEKKPAVIETPLGDVIGIRHKMFLSLSYDHRIVDGALGGAFLRRIGDYLEEFDTNRTV